MLRSAMLSPDISIVVMATRGNGVEVGVGEETDAAVTSTVGTCVGAETTVAPTAVSVGCARAVPVGTNTGVAVGCVNTPAVDETTGVESTVETGLSPPLRITRKATPTATNATNTPVKTINALRLMGIPPQY